AIRRRPATPTRPRPSNVTDIGPAFFLVVWKLSLASAWNIVFGPLKPLTAPTDDTPGWLQLVTPSELKQADGSISRNGSTWFVLKKVSVPPTTRSGKKFASKLSITTVMVD